MRQLPWWTATAVLLLSTVQCRRGDPPEPAPETASARAAPLAESKRTSTAETTPRSVERAPEPKATRHPALLEAPQHEAGPLRLLSPHQRRSHQLRGSGHTHCAPDHSGVAAATQQLRLRNLGPDHRHHFVWMTAHDFVAPDPGVTGIQHLFGVELYTKRLEGRPSPHMVALLPDGRLAGTEQRPFGVYELDLQRAASAITRAGGLSVLAHPSRYSPALEALRAVDDDLWGIEVLSGSTDPEQNARFVDARLTAGRYVCLSAGGDIHGEDYKLTSGYQVVEVERPDAPAQVLFQAIRVCNFFACGVKSPRHGPIRRPAVDVRSGEIHFSSTTLLRSIRFVGRGGKPLSEAHATTQASYRPNLRDTYVRVEAVSTDGNARCYSQPVWVLPR